MITANSRYVNSAVTNVNDDVRGLCQYVVVPLPGVTRINYTYYQVSDFDTIDLIASKTFGDGRLWWIIAEANPEILDWSHLKTGSILRLPSAT